MIRPKLGYAFCGSFCTVRRAMEQMKGLAISYETVPIVSRNVYTTDTRFGRAEDIVAEIETVSGRKVIATIPEAEPLGPKEPLDALVIAPCTGNTLAKLANGITDTPVTMAAKAHLRSDRPLVIALATNDALSANLQNIAALLGRKNVYFVPFSQDDPAGKPHSLVADFARIPETLDAALKGVQLQPLLLPAGSTGI